jgi:peroxiredoxin
MKKSIVLFCILGLVACNKEQIKISGKIDNADKMVLHLDEVDVYESKPADSVLLSPSGKFSFKLKSREAGFYQLRLSPDKIIVLFPVPGEHIKIQADVNNLLSSLTVDGSNGTEQITKLIRMLDDTRSLLDSITVEYSHAQSDSVRIRLNKEYAIILERHRKNSIAYILTHYNSLSSLYALYQQYQTGSYVFYKAKDMQFFRIVSDSLEKYYPGSKHVRALKAYTDNMINKYKSQVLIQSAPTGNSLPELALPDMAGDTVYLSSFRGNYVLLSFWASYNTASVKQNLELKKIYNQYRHRGFEIVQVSFDHSFENWRSAVRYDELPWVSVLDTRYPNSIVAGNYNITALPANYLIGKDNTSILAKDLSPAELRDKLKELLK